MVHLRLEYLEAHPYLGVVHPAQAVRPVQEQEEPLRPRLEVL